MAGEILEGRLETGLATAAEMQFWSFQPTPSRITSLGLMQATVFPLPLTMLQHQ